jgi:hypothetical protein
VEVSSSVAAVVDECSFDEVNDGDGGRNAYDELMMHSERASKMMIGDAALSIRVMVVGFLVVVVVDAMVEVSKNKSKSLHVEPGDAQRQVSPG